MSIFLSVWSFLLVHVWFTPSEGPKGFKNCIFQKYDDSGVTRGKGGI